MFAKILESPDLGQILITKEYNTNEDTDEVLISFQHDSMLIKTAIGCNSEEEQSAVFDKLDLKTVEETIRQVMPFDL